MIRDKRMLEHRASSKNKSLLDETDDSLKEIFGQIIVKYVTLILDQDMTSL